MKNTEETEMLTMWLRIAILILAAVGAVNGWWGWAAFWFGLVGGVTLRVNGRDV